MSSNDQRALRGKIVAANKLLITTHTDQTALATTCYDLVDRHINRLDADSRRMDDAIALGIRDGTLASAEAPSLTGGLSVEGLAKAGGRKKKKSGREGATLAAAHPVAPYIDPNSIKPDEPRSVELKLSVGSPAYSLVTLTDIAIVIKFLTER